MACFSLAWLEQLLIWLVFVVAIVAIFNIVVPWLMSIMGTPPGGGMIMQILKVIVWVIVAIAIIYFVFEMLGCFSGGGFGGFPRPIR